jgi:tetratricopeptide (TPR) repeat protein
LQLACIRAKQYEKAEQVLGDLVDLRTKIYGEVCEGVLQPRLQIAAIQRQLGRNEETLETCESGCETCKLLLADPFLTGEGRTSVIKLYGEFLQTIFSYYSAKRMPEKMLETAETLCGHFKNELGEQNDLYMDGVYLKSKALFASAQNSVELSQRIKQALELLDTAIAYHRSRKQKGSKGLALAMCLLLQATINKSIMLEQEAIKNYISAGRVVLQVD